MQADFYCEHPLLTLFFDNHKDLFSSKKSLLKLCVSEETFNSGFSHQELVKAEATNSCRDKKWSSFLCILALSSVTNRRIQTFYPEFGDYKYKFFFNQTILPRCFVSINILFCREGVQDANSPFQPNHFVPLVLRDNSYKRSYPNEAKKSTIPKKKYAPKQSIISYPPSTSSQTKHSDSLGVFNYFKKYPMPKKYVLPSSNNNSSVPEPQQQSDITFVDVQQSCSSSSTTLPMFISSVSSEEGEAIQLQESRKAVLDNDKATYIQKIKTLTKNEVLKLATNVFRPDPSHKFLKTNGRSFLHKWLSSFSWLAYSPSVDGAFCLPCVLFGHSFPLKNKKLSNLFHSALKNWSQAVVLFNKHQCTHKSQLGKKFDGLHTDTQDCMNKLMSEFNDVTQPINVMLDINLKSRIQEKREKLSPIVDTIKLCGHLGLPLRGHRDDTKYHPDVGSYSSGQVGNFIELLNFRVRSGDSKLEEHLKNSAKNAKYISKEIQNDLISCCGEVILEKIISEVKHSKYFSIIADEAADSSNKE